MLDLFEEAEQCKSRFKRFRAIAAFLFLPEEYLGPATVGGDGAFRVLTSDRKRRNSLPTPPSRTSSCCCFFWYVAMGQKPNRTPSEHPNPH